MHIEIFIDNRYEEDIVLLTFRNYDEQTLWLNNELDINVFKKIKRIINKKFLDKIKYIENKKNETKSS